MITKYSFKNIQQAIRFQLICLMVVINYSLSQNSQVAWSSFNMGFAESKTSNTMVKTVVGQTFVGATQQANTQIIGGFLADTLFRSVLVAVKPTDDLPTRYTLEQNYPNPFNPTTNFQFAIANSQLVTLKVYDILGREVASLMNEVKQPGRYDIRWNASGLPSGFYFYRLSAGSFTETKKLLLMK